MDKLDARIFVRGGGGREASASSLRHHHSNHRREPGACAAFGRRDSPGIARFPESDFDQIRRQQIGAIERGRGRNGPFDRKRATNLSPFPRGDIRYVRTIDEQIEDFNGGHWPMSGSSILSFMALRTASWPRLDSSTPPHLKKLPR